MALDLIWFIKELRDINLIETLIAHVLVKEHLKWKVRKWSTFHQLRLLVFVQD